MVLIYCNAPKKKLYLYFWFFLFARLYLQHVEARRYSEEEEQQQHSRMSRWTTHLIKKIPGCKTDNLPGTWLVRYIRRQPGGAVVSLYVEGVHADTESLGDVIPAVIEHSPSQGVGAGWTRLAVLVLTVYVQVTARRAGEPYNEKHPGISFLTGNGPAFMFGVSAEKNGVQPDRGAVVWWVILIDFF